MKNQFIVLTVSILLVYQGTVRASAAVDSADTMTTNRTAGIGDQAIVNARQNLVAAAQQLEFLDQSLVVAEKSILARDKSTAGQLLNGGAVVGAGLGVSLSVASRFFGISSEKGAGFVALAAGVIGAGTSFLSAVSGASGIALRPDADAKEAQAQLAKSQLAIRMVLATTTNKATLSSLTQLSSTIESAQNAILAYKEQKSEITRNKAASEITQVIGSAIIAFALTQRNSEGMMKTGVYITALGGIGAVVSGMQDSQAKQVLHEISETRKSLKVVADSLL